MAGVVVGFCGTLMYDPLLSLLAGQRSVSPGHLAAPPVIHHRLDAIAGSVPAVTLSAREATRPSTPLAALTAVTTAGDPANLPDLIVVLAGSPEAALRAEAAQGLAEIGGESAALALEFALNDPSSTVRRVAIEALAASADTHAVRVLHRAARHPDALVRRHSLEALNLSDSR